MEDKIKVKKVTAYEGVCPRCNEDVIINVLRVYDGSMFCGFCEDFYDIDVQIDSENGEVVI